MEFVVARDVEFFKNISVRHKKTTDFRLWFFIHYTYITVLEVQTQRYR